MSKHRQGSFDVDVNSIHVSGDVTAFCPGRICGPPERCYPDEGGDVEVTGSWLNGEEVELTEDEIAQAEEALLQAAADAAEDYAVSRAEYAADARAEAFLDREGL